MDNMPKEWINQTDATLVPLQDDWDTVNHKHLPASQIPRWLAEIAYTEYVKNGGRGQSLDRLNERGGFGRQEFLMFLKDAFDVAGFKGFRK
jgi:hypothetical protein